MQTGTGQRVCAAQFSSPEAFRIFFASSPLPPIDTNPFFGSTISNPSHHETNDISTFGNFLVVAASVGISLPPQGSRHVVILATGRNRLARGFQAVANFCCAIAQWTCGTILTIYWRHVSGRAISLRNEQKTTTPPILPDSRQRRQFDFCNIGQQ